MTAKLLDSIDSPDDLKGLTFSQLDKLAFELRAQMVASASLRGGHLASSLGAVELIIALHRVLDVPTDTLVFDVGHQAYAHKLLTGRKEQFKTLRSHNGISGFPKIDESPFDAHDSGHASDSLSTALGYAIARDLDASSATVAALIGDASFTGGMAMEALNNIGQTGTKMVIVLNDNGMSISPNVGGFAAYLAKIRMSHEYTTLRDQVEEHFNASGLLGRMLMDAGNVAKESVKQLVLPGNTFLEGFGLTYIGPVDGHDIATLEGIFARAKEMDGPVVVHAVTTKGKGYAPAEENPALFHGIGPFDIKTGKPVSSGDAPSWTAVFSEELVGLARQNDSIVAITAAMEDGTGLGSFAREFPERFFDVGIAEEHAVGLASALALAGKTPVVAIYSTFLQRAFDQIMINVALQNAHVIFCLDRAGLVGADGPTHHGAFDISYLRSVPGMQIMAPSNDEELRQALRCAVAMQGPVAIRYPRGSALQAIVPVAAWERGRGICLREGGDVALLAIGRMVDVAVKASDLLAQEGIECAAYSMRWVKPLDVSLLCSAAQCGHIVTLEDNSIVGGFGSAVLEALADEGTTCQITRLGLPDAFVPQGTCEELYQELDLDAPAVAARVKAALGA